MGGVRGRPRKSVESVTTAKEAADEWFAAFLLVRAAYPMADVEAQIAATDYVLRTR